MLANQCHGSRHHMSSRKTNEQTCNTYCYYQDKGQAGQLVNKTCSPLLSLSSVTHSTGVRGKPTRRPKLTDAGGRLWTFGLADLCDYREPDG